MLMVWGLGRPAVWLDEAASAIAVQRSWSQLWLMRKGTDAPLVPFYVVLKAQKSVVLQILPGAGAHLEVLLRWPSAVAIVVAAWVLVSWLTTSRHCSQSSAASSVSSDPCSAPALWPQAWQP